MTSYAWATIVSPMKMMARRIDIAVIVFAAFLASGGLNAGTPLAIASTPVSATEPEAKALSRRNRPSASVPSGSAFGWRGSGCAWPIDDVDEPADRR